MAIKVEDLEPLSASALVDPTQTEFDSPRANFKAGTLVFHGHAQFGETGNVSFDLEGLKEDFADGTPTAILIRGYGGTAESYRKLRTELARAHQPTATINDHEMLFHRDDPMSQVFSPQRLGVDSSIAVAKNISHNLGTQNRLLAHSAGGPVSARMILKAPHLFESAVFMGPAGTTGHNILTLAPRAGVFVAKEILLSARYLRVRPSLKLAAQHVIFALNPRTLPEGLAVAQSDIRDDLALIKDRIGVRVGLLLFPKDSFFDAGTARALAGDYVHEVFDYPDERADHAWTHKMQEQVARHVVDYFARLSLPESA